MQHLLNEKVKHWKKRGRTSQSLSLYDMQAACIIQFTHTKYHTLVYYMCDVPRGSVRVWHAHFIFIMSNSSSSWLTVHYVQMCHANQKWNEFTLSPNDAKTSSERDEAKKKRNEEKTATQKTKIECVECECAAHIHVFSIHTTDTVRPCSHLSHTPKRSLS